MCEKIKINDGVSPERISIQIVCSKIETLLHFVALVSRL